MAWIEDLRSENDREAASQPVHCGGIGLIPLCSQEGGKTLISGC